MSTISSVSTSTNFSAIQKQVQQIQDTLSTWQNAMKAATEATTTTSSVASTSSLTSTAAMTSSTPSTTPNATTDTSTLDKLASDIESIAAQVNAYRLANPAVAKALAAAPASTSAILAPTNPANDMKVDTLKFNEKGVRIDSGMIDLVNSTAKDMGMSALELDKLLNPETYQYRQSLYA